MAINPANDHVVVYRDAAQEWRWRRCDANGEIVAESGEGYDDRAYALEAAATYNPDCPLLFEGEQR